MSSHKLVKNIKPGDRLPGAVRTVVVTRHTLDKVILETDDGNKEEFDLVGDPAIEVIE